MDVDRLVSCSTLVNCAIWLIIWLESVGAIGSWCCIWATSSLRNASCPSDPLLSVRSSWVGVGVTPVVLVVLVVLIVRSPPLVDGSGKVGVTRLALARVHRGGRDGRLGLGAEAVERARRVAVAARLVRLLGARGGVAQGAAPAARHVELVELQPAVGERLAQIVGGV